VEPFSAPAEPPPSPHILVVDDEPQIRDILATALRRDGFRVTSRASAKDALNDLQDASIELLVTDLKMPEMTGIELIQAAKRMAPEIGSVLITAYATMETAVLALRNGADDYLMKPFGLDDLRRVVDRVLTERRIEGRGREALLEARDEAESLRRERRDSEAALREAHRDLRTSQRDLERRVRDLEFVAELTDLVATEDDMVRTLQRTARIVARRFHAHVTRIEVDPGDGLLQADHREGDDVPFPAGLGALLLERARADPAGVVSDEILGQGRPLEGLAAAWSPSSAPPGGPTGGLVLLRPLIPAQEGRDLSLLAMIPRALKPAVEADRLRRRAERDVLEVARSLLSALEGRGCGTRGHAERVETLAQRSAQWLGLSPRLARAVAIAARLHDIGEVGVPDEILARPGPLTPDETEVVRSHAVVGARVLEPLGEAADYVRHHHERPDGTGYPDGLHGGQIPIGAGLIAAAEAFDAMTHPRPYRRTLSVPDALDEIRRARGTQFVAEAVDALTQVVEA
jgi:response regulator RpfG family c-di-GMP phosphodiesterase